MASQTKQTRIYAYSPRASTATTNPCRLTKGRLGRIHAIFIHGILSTEMINALVDQNRSQNYTTHELQHIRLAPNAYICTPRGQFRTLFARSNTLYYSCTDKGVDALLAHRRITIKQADIWRKLQADRKASQFFHDAASGYLTASAELWARENRIKFLSVYEILENMPEREEPLAIKIRKGTQVCDTVFAFKDGKHDAVLYIDETDMGTEQHELSTLKRETITHKYEGYRYMLYNDTHLEAFGIETVKILFTLTKPRRLGNMKLTFKKVASEDSRVAGIGPIYLRCVPAFDPELHIKLPPTSMMLAEPWDRVDNTPTMLFKSKTADRSAA